MEKRCPGDIRWYSSDKREVYRKGGIHTSAVTKRTHQYATRKLIRIQYINIGFSLVYFNHCLHTCWLTAIEHWAICLAFLPEFYCISLEGTASCWQYKKDGCSGPYLECHAQREVNARKILTSGLLRRVQTVGDRRGGGGALRVSSYFCRGDHARVLPTCDRCVVTNRQRSYPGRSSGDSLTAGPVTVWLRTVDR